MTSPSQRRRRGARSWSLAALLAAWTTLFGYVLGPLAHELLVEHRAADAGRVEVADHDHDHGHVHEAAATDEPGYSAACPDPHEVHPCHAKAMLRAAFASLLTGPARCLTRAAGPRAPPGAHVFASVLGLAPKTSPPASRVPPCAARA